MTLRSFLQRARQRLASRQLGLLVLGLLIAMSGCDPRQTPVSVGGGPAGGTFQGFAGAIGTTVAEINPQLQFKIEPSGGSVANLVSLNRHQQDLGLVYAGDAYLGRAGQLADVQPATKNVRAVCRLYGAAAQLVVAANSQLRDPRDLIGERVAIGNPGSGTAMAAERYFSSLGLWEQIVPIFVGFKMGMEELQKGRVEALWMLVGFPNQSVRRWFEQYRLRLLPLAAATDNTDFWARYPFYEPVTIPRLTYPKQTKAVASFKDSTLLLANLQVPDSLIYQVLQRLFSAAGRARMQKLHPLGGELSLADGLRGIKIPLHGGADRFWKEQSRFGTAR